MFIKRVFKYNKIPHLRYLLNIISYIYIVKQLNMNKLKETKTDEKVITDVTDKVIIAKIQKPVLEEKKELPNKNEVLDNLFTPTTAEQRIKNLDIFKKMAEKHNFLREKADDLNAYLVSRDGMREKLIIKSDGNNEFEISNSNIIEEILNLCASKLDGLIQESNKQVLTFQI